MLFRNLLDDPIDVMHGAHLLMMPREGDETYQLKHDDMVQDQTEKEYEQDEMNINVDHKSIEYSHKLLRNKVQLNIHVGSLDNV
jgi:hypothetical protein